MNFAPRFKGPAIVGVGLIDRSCPPEGIYATVNQLKGPKQIVLEPLSGHADPHKACGRIFTPFLDEQKKK